MRENRRKSIALICFSMLILLMSWEGQKADTAAAEGLIPQESIRLRILANSDSLGDQAVKRLVRDAVVEQMNGWVAELAQPESLEEARTMVQGKLPDIEQRVGETLKANGKSYSYEVVLGEVPFPTKIYGGAVYPAGEYEAVRVTLGAGAGKNWWCVLFPPLCFVDAGSGDALQKSASAKSSEKDGIAAAKGSVDADAGADTAMVQVDPEEVEVRFFLWDMLVNFWNWITGLFA
ncbi:stage II sporulation protein R [Paenibacillus sp. MSJ-6]|uniref:Stage II sporulation protein R n=2 Tax=Paenibacillus brevis TaxID=2841508 RepID=A0ABS6FL60_9BACL|nr:stage II sporulation protein R [Paenibacillus brevis]MBU5670889.1 stage II sporulation protein R [Paenibacillus brevis]